MSDVLLFSISIIFVAVIIITFYFIYGNKNNNNNNNVIERTVYYPDNNRHNRHHGDHHGDHHRRHRNNGCRCVRQSNGGTRGFCAKCSSDGTTFGCPEGQGGCDTDCSKLRYPENEKPCDQCRDRNCDLEQQPVFEGFGSDGLSNAAF